MWKNIAEFYKENYNIDLKGLHLLCSFDVLEMIAQGNSNESINERLGLDIDEIVKISNHFYGFDGWKEDLRFLPMLQYPRYTNKYAYSQVLIQANPGYELEVLTSWNVVEKFKKLEKEFYKYD